MDKVSIAKNIIFGAFVVATIVAFLTWAFATRAAEDEAIDSAAKFAAECMEKTGGDLDVCGVLCKSSTIDPPGINFRVHCQTALLRNKEQELVDTYKLNDWKE